MSAPGICFLAISKSSCGHLRRFATIAARLSALAPERKLHLISSARPDGLCDRDILAFDTVQALDCAQMVQSVVATGARVPVLDTLTLPRLEQLGLPITLVLREMPDRQVHPFRLAAGRP